jgi:hypothetical protein
MEPEGSLPHLQQPPHIPILSQISPVHASHPASCTSILTLSSHLRLGPPSGCSLRSPHRNLVCPSPNPYVLHALPISFVCSPQYLVMSTKHDTPRYVVFATSPLPRHSEAQIPFLTLHAVLHTKRFSPFSVTQLVYFAFYKRHRT